MVHKAEGPIIGDSTGISQGFNNGGLFRKLKSRFYLQLMWSLYNNLSLTNVYILHSYIGQLILKIK